MSRARKTKSPAAGASGVGGKPEPTVGTPAVHPFVRRMELVSVPRDQIETAAYNPRLIDAAAKVKLRGGLEKFGLVETLVWNKRSKRLVAGHQRLGLMDEQRDQRRDYAVPVSVVDLDDTQERELNVLLNNPGAQGWWDWQKLAELAADKDHPFDVEAAGFDRLNFRADLESFADLKGLDLTHLFDPQDGDDAAADAAAIRTMKADKQEYKAVGATTGGDGFYLMVVGRTAAEVEKFCAAVGISPNSKNVELRVLAARVRPVPFGEPGVDIGWTPPADPPTGPAAEAAGNAG